MSKDSGYLQGEERGIQVLLIQFSVCILYHNLKRFFKRWQVREKEAGSPKFKYWFCYLLVVYP